MQACDVIVKNTEFWFVEGDARGPQKAQQREQAEAAAAAAADAAVAMQQARMGLRWADGGVV